MEVMFSEHHVDDEKGDVSLNVFIVVDLVAPRQGGGIRKGIS